MPNTHLLADKETLMAEIDQLIAEAWKSHRQGFHDKATEEFKKILQLNPDHTDALYGLGLSQKAAGNDQAAIATFTQLQERIANLSREEKETGHPGHYFMLANMVNQQLRSLQD
jgi:tetratricopeptide (TPR) repeat protein